MGRTTPTPALIYHPCYSALQLPIRHRYPIGKYQRLYERLLQAGVPAAHFIQQSPAATQEQLQTVHCQDYIQSLCDGSIDPKRLRRIGFPWSEFLIYRSLQSCGGTMNTVDFALRDGLALHLSGGYHHAFHADGAGFCLFNDLALAAQHALTQGISKVLIFDCDVHQGDGTAAIFQQEPRVITASLHGEKNFPARKQQSDWDIGLANQCHDHDYLEAVQQSLDYLLRLHQPELVIYDAGVDIHIHDDLGLLHVSTAGIRQRDRLVLQRCHDAKIPVAAVIGGGYQRDLEALTTVHLQLFAAAFELSNPALSRAIDVLTGAGELA